MPTPSRRRAAKRAVKAAPSPFAAVYAIVRRIPRGRVMSYGQISQLLGKELSARAVGWAMRACPTDLPWHRVVNARGGCSSDDLPDHPGLQRALLEAEGVPFNRAGCLPIESLRWAPPIKGAKRAARTRK